MELKKACLNCWEAGADLTLTQEETLETIVPDYCPDIARIIDTAGKVFLHSRELRDGKILITGTVKVTVLYTPEDDGGIRSLEFALPFTTEGEGTGEHLSVKTEIESVETRMTNPRKVFTRCLLSSRVCCFRRTERPYCSDVEAEPALGIEKRLEAAKVNTVAAIAEKEFTFSDELNISPGKNPAEEILLSSVRDSISETKIVGNKLIIKGLFTISLLCSAAEKQYYSAGGELPFSQIIELEAPAEDSLCSVSLQLTGAEFKIGEDGHTVTVTLYLHAQAQLREEQTLTLLSDLYSTAHAMTYDAAPMELSDYIDTVSRRQTVREVLEIGVVAKTILAISVACGTVTHSREGEVVTLRTTASIHALYLDEGGVPLVSERRMEVNCQMEFPENCQITARAVCPEDAMGSLSSGGIEIRFPVDFSAEATVQKSYSCVMSADIDLEAAQEDASRPSIVLRCLAPSESLWDLAKRYRTTCANILSANELEEGTAIPCDRLLLIPKKRV
ncbi:DUF3794 domain-containing protein [Oscillibacter sp. MSJ-2]|uniref:DUF3794 domain-containing protein n=1 Tax=Dysosmobacter acutus TaxID=2841504 RepID=A0ABS6FAE3_9FIRM|nr:DUF3794 domain-containing protein [Dysosmobacter acutus]MBU5627261.1 DUF3794 domain-containing protein [Dysosmobacter acutus]